MVNTTKTMKSSPKKQKMDSYAVQEAEVAFAQPHLSETIPWPERRAQGLKDLQLETGSIQETLEKLVDYVPHDECREHLKELIPKMPGFMDIFVRLNTEEDYAAEVKALAGLDQLILILAHKYLHEESPYLPKYDWSQATDKKWFELLVDLLEMHLRRREHIMNDTKATVSVNEALDALKLLPSDEATTRGTKHPRERSDDSTNTDSSGNRESEKSTGSTDLSLDLEKFPELVTPPPE